NFARMPSPRPFPQNINAIVREVLALYQGAHKDLEIDGAFAEEIPPVQVDRDQIKRVLVNLFENAAEAMGHKGRIRIATSHDPAHRICRIEVSDEGIGIPPEDIDKLFLPYFSKKKSGTGLGLAIVNRIISDHNGQIRVKPNHPSGTTFAVELPA
ncbi:MAG TPA: ATP-binding protein, partial [Nitrospiria bacterium]|nr:ATP-binding protein [Nitrospiria bacterium]